jgi:uncharacterized membrane protein HdeD (DUF308 family)
MKKTSQIISAAMTLALGILFVILKSEVVGIGLTVLGVALIVTAIIDIIRKSYAYGIIKAILGIAVLVIGWLIIEVAIFVIGAVLLVYGILEFIKRLAAKKKGRKAWVVVLGLIQPLVCIVASVFLIVKGGTALSLAVVVAGVLLIVDGVLALIGALGSKK